MATEGIQLFLLTNYSEMNYAAKTVFIIYFHVNTTDCLDFPQLISMGSKMNLTFLFKNFRSLFKMLRQEQQTCLVLPEWHLTK